MPEQTIAQPLGIIGGSGLYNLDAVVKPQKLDVETPYGRSSASLITGLWHECPVIFVTRHGDDHSLAPHEINYRANVWALREAGVKSIVSINCVGGIHSQLTTPGSICAPDQFLDYTWGRSSTFFADGKVEHVDMTDPCDDNLRTALLRAGESFNVYQGSCCYAAMQGPRLETRAEINRLERDGADIVGMTAMPEVPLARELRLPIAMLSLVVNPAAGRGVIQRQQIATALQRGMQKIQSLLDNFLSEQYLIARS